MKRLGLAISRIPVEIVGVGESLFDVADVECRNFEPEPNGD